MGRVLQEADTEVEVRVGTVSGVKPEKKEEAGQMEERSQYT